MAGKKLRNPLNSNGTSDATMRDDALPGDAIGSPTEEVAPSTNGTGHEPNPLTDKPAATAIISRPRSAKGATTVFYQIQGQSKDGANVDVLGVYTTRNRAVKALEGMGLAVTRHYASVTILQCRDKTNV